MSLVISLVSSGALLAQPANTSGQVFQIETVSGQTLSGTWLGASKDSIRLSDDGKPIEIAFDQLVSLAPKQTPNSRTGPAIQVSTAMGSEIRVQDLKLTGSDLNCEPRRQDSLTLPIDQVRSIRFRLGGATTDPQWLGFFDKEYRNDVMVIRRGGQQLDPIEGVVVGLDLQTLEFEIDGEKIDAPLGRLEGVLFRNGAQIPPRAAVQIVDVYGSTWAVSQLAKFESPQSIKVLLSGGIEHQIPIDQIESIRWTSGRMMLASQTPADSGVDLYVKTNVSDSLTKAWFAPAPEGEDIVAVAGAYVDYRIEPGFQTLAGSVARDKSASLGGSVSVRLSVDNAVRWEQEIDQSKTLGFRLPLNNGRRVRLEVVGGADGDVGDQVRFIKPRLLK